MRRPIERAVTFTGPGADVLARVLRPDALSPRLGRCDLRADRWPRGSASARSCSCAAPRPAAGRSPPPCRPPPRSSSCTTSRWSTTTSRTRVPTATTARRSGTAGGGGGDQCRRRPLRRGARGAVWPGRSTRQCPGRACGPARARLRPDGPADRRGAAPRSQPRGGLGRGEARYLAMIAGKTAAIMDFAARAGAGRGPVPKDGCARFGAFGLALGLAFQIRDDMLGIWVCRRSPASRSPTTSGGASRVCRSSRSTSAPTPATRDELRRIYGAAPLGRPGWRVTLELLNAIEDLCRCCHSSMSVPPRGARRARPPGAAGVHSASPCAISWPCWKRAR